jgi:molybdate transport system substrate-binding protein
VRLFVAASLVDVAQAWQRDFAETGGRFEIHSGGSALLARQVLAGAEADFLLSAGMSPVRELNAAGRIAKIDSNYFHNRIVLVCAPHVTPPDNIAALADAPFARIAMANPATAPAGEYARDGLRKAGLWDELTPRFVFTDDVRATLAAVISGAVDAGFVYVTDARSMPALRMADFEGESAFPEAAYPLVMIAPETQAKAALWDYLHSQRARKIAARFGFEQ